MIEKYYSEKTKKTYDKKEDCLAAEVAYDKAHEAELKEREVVKKDADEIETAYNELIKARKHYFDLIEKFAKNHGRKYRLEVPEDYFENLFDFLFR